MRTFGFVIEVFGGPAKFGTAIGIPAPHARVMKCRDSIPPGYWPAVIAAAAKARLNVTTSEATRLRLASITYEMLAGCAASKRRDNGQRRTA
jgi:hypothetical protein